MISVLRCVSLMISMVACGKSAQDPVTSAGSSSDASVEMSDQQIPDISGVTQETETQPDVSEPAQESKTQPDVSAPL